MKATKYVLYLDNDGSSGKVQVEFRWWNSNNMRVLYEVEVDGPTLTLKCKTPQQSDTNAVGQTYKEISY